MAKIAETYIALKVSKLIKDNDNFEFELDVELNDVIVGAIEELLESAGETGLIVEVVAE